MLKTPPGINKREGSSKSIEEAGAVFDSLYKKYLNTENIQKQAENYLLKSLYNKTVSKKKAAAPESGDSTSGLAGSSHPNGQTPKGPHSPKISKLVDYYQNLPQHVKGSGAQGTKATSGKLNHRVSFEDQQPPRSLTSFNSVSGSVTGNSVKGLHGLPANSPLAAHISSFNNGSVSDNISDVSDDIQLNRNYIRIQKVPLDDQNSDTTELNSFGVSKNGGDSPEDPLEDIDYFSSPSTSRRYSRYFSNISTKRKDSLYVSTVCILVQSLLFVFLLTGFLLLNSYIINRPIVVDGKTEGSGNSAAGGAGNSSGGGGGAAAGGEGQADAKLRGSEAAGADNALSNRGGPGSDRLNSSLKEIVPLRNCFVNVSFPFLIHFVLFYAVFNYADDYLRKKQLMYTNDFNLEVVTKRLNREIAFTNLSRVTFWFDKAVIILAVIIACFPFAGTYNLKLWTYTEPYITQLVDSFGTMIRNIASKFTFRIPPVFAINTVATATASSSRINTPTYVLNKDSMPLPNNTLIGTFNSSTITYNRVFTFKDYNHISTSFDTITCNINNNSNCDLIDTPENVSSIVDGVEVEKMELKKRLYKSYKSRKLSNPSTKSRRRHMQSNR